MNGEQPGGEDLLETSSVAPSPRRGTAITIAGVLVIALATAGLTVVIGNVRSGGAATLDFAAARSVESMRMVMVSTIDDVEFMRFDLRMDVARERAHGTMTVSGSALNDRIQDAPEYEFLLAGEQLHMRVPDDMRSLLPEGTTWMRLPDEHLTAALGGAAPFGPVTDPIAYLEGLRDIAVEIEERGSQVIRGQSAQVYDLQLDLERLLRQIPTMTGEQIDDALQEMGPTLPSTIWIGDDGLPYRQQMSFRADDQDIAFTTDFLDYGASFDIPVPSEDEIADAPDGWASKSAEASCTYSVTGSSVGGGDPQPTPSASCSP